MRTLLRPFQRTGLAAASLAATLVALEVPAYLGWVDWSDVVGLPPALRFTRLKPWDNPANVRDPELLFRHRPLSRFEGETPGDLVDLYGIATDRRYAVDVAYDENGFRNPPGRTSARVVLIGDSFLEAGLVAREETVAARMEAALGAPVANLGCSGYGPQQERIVLERYGLPLRPEAVVWLFFEGNDLIDVGRYDEALRSGGMDPTRTRFRARSLVANLGRRIALLLERRRGEDADAARQRRGVLRRGGREERLYFAYVGQPLTDADRAHLEEARAILREADRRTREAGARFLLAFVPTKLRVYEGLVDFEEGTLAAGWKPNELPGLLAAFAEASGIEWLDLTPALRAAAGRGELVHLEDDGHWSPHGNAVVAEAVLERLR